MPIRPVAPMSQPPQQAMKNQSLAEPLLAASSLRPKWRRSRWHLSSSLSLSSAGVPIWSMICYRYILYIARATHIGQNGLKSSALNKVYELVELKQHQVDGVTALIQSLAPLNSAANPLIYCLFSTNIGTKISNILCCRKKQEVLPTGLTTTTNSSSSRPILQHEQSSSLRSAGPASSSAAAKPNAVTFRTVAASIES